MLSKTWRAGAHLGDLLVPPELGWRPKVLPPRSTSGRKGVFSTRSPHRPNPLGLSVVRLERVEGLTLHIRDSDMVDGTPVLDLKPYVAYTDAHPGAGAGWLEDEAPSVCEQPTDPLCAYAVHFTPLATEQSLWIEAHTGLAIRDRIQSTLALGPAPHPYRRIRPHTKRNAARGQRVACAFRRHRPGDPGNRYLVRIPEPRNLPAGAPTRPCGAIANFWARPRP
ncbi:MAG: SAM-dependent methyltransferase [Pseudorhodoferax sp.]